ncbi:MAG: hypothetical protein IJT86_03490 [Spirochaetales bacterium]|nr:hypothetical protein [Spirochaetales bacterium]MBQ7729395.1 hypothetical protein [Spirochaetales bacterium]
MKAMFLAKPGFSLYDSRYKDSIGNLIAILREFQTVFTSPELFKECKKEKIKAVSLDRPKNSQGNQYVQDINFMVSQCLKENVDVYITAGGDGTVSYVASSTIVSSHNRTFRPMFIGFPAGTANAGPIVHKLGKASIKDLSMVKIDAIEVTDGDEIIGYGFNDVIIGDTFLGTKDSQMVNLAAKAMAESGKAEIARPGCNITSDSFCATLNGDALEIRDKVRQICVSTLQFDKLDMRAIFGGLLNSIGEEHPASVAFIDRVIVDSDPSTWNYRGPVSTTHVCFNEKDVLEVSGFGADAQIIIDGNPFIRKTDRLSFRIVPWACTALWDKGER